jgi:hypothetical protein
MRAWHPLEKDIKVGWGKIPPGTKAVAEFQLTARVTIPVNRTHTGKHGEKLSKKNDQASYER